MTTSTQPKKGRLDVRTIAQTLHLPEKAIREVFGLKSPDRIAIEYAKDLNALKELGYSKRFDDDDKKYFVERREYLAIEVLLAHSGTLEDLLTAWEKVREYFSPSGRWDGISAARDELAKQILADPARMPKSLPKAKFGLGKGFSKEIEDELHRSIDGFIDQMLRNKIHDIKALGEVYKEARDTMLRERIVKLVREQIKSLYDAVLAYSVSYEGYGKSVNPFGADVRDKLQEALDRAKTATAKLKVMTSEKNLDGILGRISSFPYWEQVFKAYLAEDSLDEASRLLRDLFRGDSWQDKDVDRVARSWNALYHEAYDRIHLKEITREKTLEELGRVMAKTPFGTIAYERLQAFVKEKLSLAIEAAADLDALLTLAEHSHLSDEQESRLRERKSFFLQGRLLDAKSEEDYLNFWKILDSTEKIKWLPGVVRGIAAFHLIEDVADLVELPT